VRERREEKPCVVEAEEAESLLQWP